MDLTSDANLKLLLSFALEFKESYDKAVWKIVEGWLSQQKVERLATLLEEQFVVHAFRRLNKRPLKLLFGSLKVPFSTKLRLQKEGETDEVQLQILGLNEIKIGKVRLTY